MTSTIPCAYYGYYTPYAGGQPGYDFRFNRFPKNAQQAFRKLKEHFQWPGNEDDSRFHDSYAIWPVDQNSALVCRFRDMGGDPIHNRPHALRIEALLITKKDVVNWPTDLNHFIHRDFWNCLETDQSPEIVSAGVALDKTHDHLVPYLMPILITSIDNPLLEKNIFHRVFKIDDISGKLTGTQISQDIAVSTHLNISQGGTSTRSATNRLQNDSKENSKNHLPTQTNPRSSRRKRINISLGHIILGSCCFAAGAYFGNRYDEVQDDLKIAIRNQIGELNRLDEKLNLKQDGNINELTAEVSYGIDVLKQDLADKKTKIKKLDEDSEKAMLDLNNEIIKQKTKWKSEIIRKLESIKGPFGQRTLSDEQINSVFDEKEVNSIENGNRLFKNKNSRLPMKSSDDSSKPESKTGGAIKPKIDRPR